MKRAYLILFLFLATVTFGGNSDREKSSKKTVAGRITDQSGNTVTGTSITIIETGEVFYANLDGQFNLTLNADKTYTLRLSCLGYQPLDVKSNGLTAFSDLTLTTLY